MQIFIKGKGIDVGDALRTHVTDALTDHLQRYFDRSMDAHVTLSKEHSAFQMDIALHVPGEILAAQAEAADPYAAYDAAAHKLFTQVKKHKSRVRDHHKDDGERNSMAEKAKSA